jgi:hypothetical protein
VAFQPGAFQANAFQGAQSGTFGHAQAQVFIDGTKVVFAQANAYILGSPCRHAQAEASIKQSYQGHAQAQTFMYGTTVYDTKVVADGADHYWKLHLNSDDFIGTKHGTSNSITHGQTGPLTGSFSTNFPDSDSSYVSFPDGTGLPLGNADRTIEWWAQTSKTGSQVIIGYGLNANGQHYTVYYTYNSYDFGVSKHGNDPGIPITGDIHRDGSWRHGVVRYTGATTLLEFFIDGKYQGSTTFGTNANTQSNYAMIGGLYYSGGFAFAGNLSQVSVYSTNLTDLQIANHALGHTSVQPAQAQAFILNDATKNQHAQAQAYITGKPTVHAQAQALIFASKVRHAQAQARIILQRASVHAQAEAFIFPARSRFAQAQTRIILQRASVHAQAEAFILRRISARGQAQAQIKQTYTKHAQAQTTLATKVSQPAQANAMLLGIGKKHAQARVVVVYPIKHAQAQAQIKNGNQVYAQTQAYLKRPKRAYAQAQAYIAGTARKHAQAMALIDQHFGFAQAGTYITGLNSRHANAQAYIALRAGFAQAMALMYGTITFQPAQAQARIRNTYNAYAQTRTKILTSRRGYAQAQTYLKYLSTSNVAQAQAYIIGPIRVAQAQAQILRQPFGWAQAQTRITRTQGYSQAAAAIATGGGVIGGGGTGGGTTNLDTTPQYLINCVPQSGIVPIMTVL